MHEEARTWGERRLLRWSRGVRRRRRPILLLALLSTGVALWLAATRLGVDTNTSSLVADDLEFRRIYRDFKSAFGDIDDELIVLIEAETPALADAAAGRLAAELAADTAMFRSVYRPDGGTWLDRVGLLLQDADAVRDVADRVQPYVHLLVDVERDPSLAGLSSALDAVLEERRLRHATSDSASESADLSPVLGLLAASAFGAIEGRFVPAPWSALASGEAPSAQERRQTLSLRPRLAFANAVPGRAAMDRVRRAVAELGLIERNGIHVRLTGIVAIEAEELDTAVAGVRQTGILAGIAVALILFLGLRSMRLVLSSVATLAAGLVLTSAFAAVAVGSLNLISVAFAVLYVGLGIDYAIHLCLRYRSHRAQGQPTDDAIDLAVVEVGPSLCVSALTTAACFFAFIPTDFTGVSELGLIGGTGMFISVFATLTLLPALVAVLPLRQAPGGGHGMPSLGVAVGRFRPLLLGGAVLATVGSLLVLPGARFDANPLNLRDPASESVVAYRTLLADPVAKPLTLSLLAADSGAAHASAERLARIPEVEGVRTLESFVPTEQPPKLDALASLELPPREPRADPGSAPDLERFRRTLGELRWSGTPEERTWARQLDVLLGRWDRRASEWPEPQRALQARLLETSWLGGLPDQVARLRAAASGPVDAGAVPSDLRRRWATPDGRRRVEILPRDPLLTTAELERFVTAVQEVEPAVTGDAVNQFGTGRVAVEAFRNALLGAAAVTMILLVVLMRSVLTAGLVVLPLAAAAAWTGALTVWLDAPFNFANVIALPLLLGVGVDNGIHMVHQVRARPGRGDPLAASTGRAVLFASLTTMASFGNLAFAVHVGMASMGRLLTLGMAGVLAGTLLVLPALLGIPAIARRVAPGYTNGAAPPPRA